MTYQPAPQQQFSPVTAFSPVDCVPTTCAMGADRVTVGAKRVNHDTIRKASGDTAGGITYRDATIGTAKATGVVGEPRYYISPDDYKALLLGGFALTTSIEASATFHTDYHTGSLASGGHSVFANDYDPATDTVNIKDPGTNSTFRRWPFALVVKAALARTGNNGINVIVWPDTEGVKRKANSSAGYFRVSPSMTAAAKGKVTVGYVYYIGSTVNGGVWTRADGGHSSGWHRVSNGLYVLGRGIQ